MGRGSSGFSPGKNAQYASLNGVIQGRFSRIAVLNATVQGEVVKTASLNAYTSLYTTYELTSSLNAYIYSSTLLNGLVSYWKLDGDGTDVVSAQDGVVTGSGWIPGKIGQGFDFNNTTARSIVAPAFDPPGAFSVSFWLYPKTGGISNYPQMVGQMLNGSGTQNFTILGVSNTATYYHYGNSSQGSVDFSSYINQWCHIVFTRSMSGSNATARGYINGVLGFTSSTFTVTQVPTANFRMGTRIDNYSALNGALDEVAVWSRALTGAEILELYNSGSGKTYPF